MRHNKKRGMKLGTDASHTKAMKKSLVRALFENDRIKTIDVRAKAIRGDVDKIDHLGQEGRHREPSPCHRRPRRQGPRPRGL